jgi:hypothetical protein
MNLPIIECFDNKNYAKLAFDNRNKYLSNTPFPHIVFDNFLANDIANTLAADYPSVENNDIRWKYHNNENVDRYFVEDTRFFGDNLRQFANAVNSRSFLLFLETLTGIPSLIPDPYFIGGGAMATGPGGFLNVHVDFNWHQRLQSWRRCNALFYLNPSWEAEWGGELELWSIDGKTKQKELKPLFNRVVIFSTTKQSFHGQPSRTKSPPGQFRNVFSAFYYASERSDLIDENPHFTRYNEKNKNVVAQRETSPYSQKIIDDYLEGIS